MKKTIKLLALVLVLFSLTGCTKYVKVDKKTVTIKETGQNLTDNILCKPTNKNTLKLYEDNKKHLSFKMDELPDCDNYKIKSSNYSGLWDTLFIKPLAWLILKLGNVVNNLGISIMLLGVAIRLILLPFSYSSMKQSQQMKKLQPKIQKIEKKYAGKTDQESMMMKSQETMALYKEYKVKPLSGCLVAFIQLPIFLGFLEAIYRIPTIFEDTLFTLNLGMTPLKGITNHNYWYIIVLVLVLLSTYFSFKNAMSQTAGTNPEMQKQMNMMPKIMIVMIGIASLSLSTALSLYWIVTNIFAIIQNFVFNKILKEE